MILLRHCITPWFKIDTRYRTISLYDSGVFLRVTETRVAGFLTSWILDSSGWIPDSMSWIPDSTG